jgi:hypothetical protein
MEERVLALEQRNSFKTLSFDLLHGNNYCKCGIGWYLGCKIVLAVIIFMYGVRKYIMHLLNL